MLNQRVNQLIAMRDGGFIFTIDNSRHASRELAYEHGARVVEKIDKTAGRIATDRELRMGFTPVDTATVRERVARDSQHFSQPENEPSNPWKKLQGMKARGEYTRGHEKPETDDERIQRLSNEWEAEQAAKSEAAERLADPARQKAIAHALAERQRLVFTFGHTQSELTEATRRIKLAKTGSLAEYAQADKSWRTLKQAKIDAASEAVSEKIAMLIQERDNLNQSAFEPVAPTDDKGRPIKTAADGSKYVEC